MSYNAIVINTLLLAMLLVISFVSQIDAKDRYSVTDPSLAMTVDNEIPAMPPLAELH